MSKLTIFAQSTLFNYLLAQHLKRIVIIGPESTGKSTLATQLAAHFKTVWVPEYARTYLEEIDRPYNVSDLLEIAKGQISLEDRLANVAKNEMLFCDTDLYVLKVWSESKYGTCHEFILENIAARKYDLYILTDIDMPWADDPLREHPEPEMRQHFFDVYKDIVLNAGVPFVLVSGDEISRLKQAIVTVVELIS